MKNFLKPFLFLAMTGMLMLSCVETKESPAVQQAAPAEKKGVEINLNTDGKSLKIKTDNTKIDVNNDDVKS
jgi:hypothetical protein